MRELTKKQKHILQLIADSIDRDGYPPSYQEMADQLNIKSKNAIKKHIDALVKKGYLEKAGLARTLKIINSQFQPKAEHEMSVPLIGRIAAGFPVLAEENVERYVQVPRNLIKSEGRYYALKVRGDSMVNAGIFEDDMVIVKAASTAANNDVVVALINDEVTVKRLIVGKQETYLKAENPSYDNIYPRQDWSIQGKVIGLVRENI